MPFRPELGFLYRTLKSHIERQFPEVTVERADDVYLTKPILDNIVDFIKHANLVIADCSGRNPNVFYELGMAHALGRDVILITSDDMKEAPTDVRAFAFISYADPRPATFLAQLDAAVGRLVGNPFADLHPEAVQLLERFCDARGHDLVPIDQEAFVAAMKPPQGGRPLPRAPSDRAELLVRRVLGGEPDIDILSDLRAWAKEAHPVKKAPAGRGARRGRGGS